MANQNEIYAFFINPKPYTRTHSQRERERGRHGKGNWNWWRGGRFLASKQQTNEIRIDHIAKMEFNNIFAISLCEHTHRERENFRLHAIHIKATVFDLFRWTRATWICTFICVCDTRLLLSSEFRIWFWASETIPNDMKINWTAHTQTTNEMECEILVRIFFYVDLEGKWKRMPPTTQPGVEHYWFYFNFFRKRKKQFQWISVFSFNYACIWPILPWRTWP